MKIYKEYFIDELKKNGSAFVYTEKVDGLDEDFIHVIEFEAFDEALKEISELKEIIAALEGEDCD